MVLQNRQRMDSQLLKVEDWLEEQLEGRHAQEEGKDSTREEKGLEPGQVEAEEQEGPSLPSEVTQRKLETES